MGNTASNVSTGKPNISGAVYIAATTETAPTDATTSLGTGFTCLGFVSDDGLTNDNSLTMNAIKAWGGVTVYNSLTDMADKFQLKLIESENADVLKAVYGDSNVTVGTDGDISVDVKTIDPPEKMFVFELALRGNKKKRIVVPDGAITSRDAIEYKDDSPIAYGITIDAYPNSSGSTHKEYIE